MWECCESLSRCCHYADRTQWDLKRHTKSFFFIISIKNRPADQNLQNAFHANFQGIYKKFSQNFGSLSLQPGSKRQSMALPTNFPQLCELGTVHVFKLTPPEIETELQREEELMAPPGFWLMLYPWKFLWSLPPGYSPTNCLQRTALPQPTLGQSTSVFPEHPKALGMW